MNKNNNSWKGYRDSRVSITVGVIIVLALSTIQLSSMIVSNGNAISVANNVYAKYSNTFGESQYLVNDCGVGESGASPNCGINGLQIEADGAASAPVISQRSTSGDPSIRNNINIDSISGQQNSGDTAANGGNSIRGGGSEADQDGSGYGSDANQDNSGDTGANGGNFVGGDLNLNVEKSPPSSLEQEIVSRGGTPAESDQSTRVGENQVEGNNQGITTDPFILPFNGN